jgi:hypothetical protein
MWGGGGGDMEKYFEIQICVDKQKQVLTQHHYRNWEHQLPNHCVNIQCPNVCILINCKSTSIHAHKTVLFPQELRATWFVPTHHAHPPPNQSWTRDHCTKNTE